MNDISAQVNQLRQTITDEIYRVAGFSKEGISRRMFGLAVWPPTQRVARLAAEFDHDVSSLGYREASRRLLQKFVDEVHVRGRENVPNQGPLVIASNHPGTYDGFAIASSIPRDDMKVVVQGFPFANKLPGSSQHLILTPQDAGGRIGVVRSMIRHLQVGGSVLIFPSGELDPDPDVLPGASDALEKWSPSLELILKRVPQTQVLVTIVSGVLAQSCVENPFTRFFDDFWMRMRVAEMIQVVQQTFIWRDFNLNPKITFGDPVSVCDLLQRKDASGFMIEIIERAKQLLDDHTGEDFQAAEISG